MASGTETASKYQGDVSMTYVELSFQTTGFAGCCNLESVLMTVAKKLFDFKVCNAVAVASLLNATLVIPKFLHSNVWKDPCHFGDIYQADYFIKTLKDEVNIVKDLPPHLESLDVKELGSLITDADLSKEATSI